ncbi:hypothetical protein ABPG75_010499 [Micractinium tetrahymenae]
MPSPADSGAARPAGATAGDANHTQEAARLAAAGADLAAEGQFAAAAAIFQQALALGPAPAAAAALHEMLAQCRMAEGEDEAAYEEATAAVQLRSRWRAALLTLGRAARNAGWLREAAAALESYLQGAAAAAEVAGPAGLRGAATGRSAAETAAAAAGTAAQEAAATQGVAAAACSAAETGEDEENEAVDEEEVASARQELEELRSLRQLQLGHQLGLPGLRVLEQHGSATGPGSVVWEAGALLAWFLVQQARDGARSGGSSCACEQPACSSGSGTGDGASCAVCTVPGSGSSASRSASGGSGCGARAAPPTGSVLCGARVLELGSGGTALVGIAAACLGAHVVATDLPEVLPQLQAAAALNAGMVTAAAGSLRCTPLDWAAPNSALLAPPGSASDQYAWLLGADLVYSLAHVQPLVETIAAAAAAVAAAGAPPLRLLVAHKPRHEDVDVALLGGLCSAGLPLRAVARDAGSRCTIYANEAAAAALRAAKQGGAA